MSDFHQIGKTIKQDWKFLLLESISQTKHVQGKDQASFSLYFGLSKKKNETNDNAHTSSALDTGWTWQY